MSTSVRRFPVRREAQKRLKPVCLQCGCRMTGAFPRDSDWLDHELQVGVELRLRVFADSSDPHECGHVGLRISEDGLVIGWFGDEEHFGYSWADLLEILKQWDGIAAGPSARRGNLEVILGDVP